MISQLEKTNPSVSELSNQDISLIYRKSLIFPDGNDISETQSDETRQTYTESALLYSMIEWSKKLTYKTWRETRKPFIKELISSGLEAEEILFAGCGSGRDIKWVSSFLKRIGKKPIVRGVDYSPSMIEIARKSLGENVTLNIEDITDLTSISSESLGSVFCESAMTHLSMADMNKALREFFRIIKPGGVAFIGFRSLDDETMSSVYTTKNDIGNRHYLRMSIEKQELALREAGFEINWKNSSQHIDSKRPAFTNYIVKK